MKMYITQLRGVFEAISQENEDSLEEAGRRIAQTLLSKGKVFVYEFGHPSLIKWEATESENALPHAEHLFTDDGKLKELSERDTALLFISKGFEENGCELLDKMQPYGIQLIGALATSPSSDHLEKRLDSVLRFPSSGPLIPLDNDTKRGNPENLSLLFLYHLLYFSVIEILSEQDLLGED